MEYRFRRKAEGGKWSSGSISSWDGKIRDASPMWQSWIGRGAGWMVTELLDRGYTVEVAERLAGAYFQLTYN